jgi:RNase P protein component
MSTGADCRDALKRRYREIERKHKMWQSGASVIDLNKDTIDCTSALRLGLKTNNSVCWCARSPQA